MIKEKHARRLTRVQLLEDFQLRTGVGDYESCQTIKSHCKVKRSILISLSGRAIIIITINLIADLGCALGAGVTTH